MPWHDVHLKVLLHAQCWKFSRPIIWTTTGFNTYQATWAIGKKRQYLLTSKYFLEISPSYQPYTDEIRCLLYLIQLYCFSFQTPLPSKFILGCIRHRGVKRSPYHHFGLANFTASYGDYHPARGWQRLKGLCLLVEKTDWLTNYFDSTFLVSLIKNWLNNVGISFWPLFFYDINLGDNHPDTGVNYH